MNESRFRFGKIVKKFSNKEGMAGVPLNNIITIDCKMSVEKLLIMLINKVISQISC